ncbi:MAG: hypothetical protein AAF125_16535, partial [Chloroflexota bacterium]
MRKWVIRRLIFVLLAATTLATLALNLPGMPNLMAAGPLSLLLFAVLTGLAVAVGVVLKEGEFSLAHAIGILA